MIIWVNEQNCVLVTIIWLNIEKLEPHSHQKLAKKCGKKKIHRVIHVHLLRITFENSKDMQQDRISS